MSPDRRTLLSLFSLAFGIRVLYAAIAATHPSLGAAQPTYDFLVASRIFHNFDWLDTPFYAGPPAYVLFLAVLFQPFGASYWVAVMAQSVIGAATVFPLYRLGEKRFATGVGLLSAIWFSAYVHQVLYASLMVRDVLVVFVFTMFIFSVAKQFHRMRSAIWSGVLYTLLLYLEPSFILFAPLLVLFFFVAATHHRTLNVQYLFMFVATVALLSVPWTVRNYAVYKDVAPVSIRLGRLNDTGQRAVDRSGHVRVERLRENLFEFSRLVRVKDAPARAGRPPEPAWSLRHNAINIFSLGLLLPFAVVGGVVVIRRRHRAGIVVTGAILFYLLMSVVLGGSERARLPIEPLVILLAFFGFSRVMSLLRGTTVESDGG